METWEVVVILVLITLAVSVIAKQGISYSLMGLLDNTLFQLAILGITLGIATVSPAVGIVAIATIVIVYYIRNVAKIDMVSDEYEVNRAVDQMLEDDSPRLVVQEESEQSQEQSTPVSSTDLPAPAPKLHDVLNRDTVDTALSEHVSRPPIGVMSNTIGSRSSIGGGSPPMQSVLPPSHENMSNPRGTSVQAEPFDTQAGFNSAAPNTSLDTNVAPPAVDSNVFAAAPANVETFNEGLAPPVMRPFSDGSGQYSIGSPRPESSYGRYEVAQFTPGNDMGLNEFKPLGASIDDKLNNLKLGITASSAPPPNFDRVVPPRA